MIISTDPSAPADIDAADDPGELGPAFELRPFRLGPQWHNQRLDRALASQVPEFSRSYLQQLIELGAVRIGGRVAARSAQRVKAGDEGEVELRPTPQSQAFVAEAMALQVIYQDEHLCVIDKPAGLVVHPAPGHWRGTLLNGLLAYDARAAFLPRAGIVHRLDKDTSGLMVVARERSAMDALVRMIAAREVSREYLALAHGTWSGAAAREVEAPIGRDPANRLRMAVVDLTRHNGKAASTRIELMGQAADGCCVHAVLRTGRTHQIRVHMAHLNHPLVADALYGGRPLLGMRRQALHAWRLALTHPVTGAALAFQAPPPADLQAALSEWGVHYN